MGFVTQHVELLIAWCFFLLFFLHLNVSFTGSEEMGNAWSTNCMENTHKGRNATPTLNSCRKDYAWIYLYSIYLLFNKKVISIIKSFDMVIKLKRANQRCHFLPLLFSIFFLLVEGFLLQFLIFFLLHNLIFLIFYLFTLFFGGGRHYFLGT